MTGAGRRVRSRDRRGHHGHAVRTGWWSTGSTTPRKSWSSRSGRQLKTPAASTPAPPSWATARVALILDVAGLAAKAGMTSVSGSARAAELAEQEAAEQRAGHAFAPALPQRAGRTLRDAARPGPAHRAHRPRTRSRRLGGRRTMQYRGGSLPLVTLADAAAVKPIGRGQDLAVVVFSVHGREVGLLGAMPVDVVETKAAVDQATHRQKGIAGSAIIRDKTVLSSTSTSSPTPSTRTGRRSGPAAAATGASARTVLLAEDSDFFRVQVKRYLSEDGYTVLAAADGEPPGTCSRRTPARSTSSSRTSRCRA